MARGLQVNEVKVDLKINQKKKKNNKSLLHGAHFYLNSSEVQMHAVTGASLERAWEVKSQCF